MSMKKEDYKTLTGVEKSAIFMLAIGEEQAAKLFRLMDDDEIRDLSQAMAGLGGVGSNIVERLFKEFAESLSSSGSLVGSYEGTERLLMKFMDKDRVGNIMEEIRGPAGRTMWDKLGNVSEEVLANFLKNEYPQTVAVVLSKIKPDHAARVIGLFPDSFAMEVIMRMLRMENVQKEILSDVEKTLKSEFMSTLAITNRTDPHEMMAEIFNNFDRSTETKFLTALEERNKESSEKIKSLMFTFEDLKRLDPSGIQTLLRGIDKEKLPIALKGASDTVKDLFFSNMSERAAKILREDMESMGPVRLRDVEEAQMSVVTTAKDLSGRGEIIIADESGQDEFVY